MNVDPQLILEFVKFKDPENHIAVICEALALDVPADTSDYKFDSGDLRTYYVARIEGFEDKVKEFNDFVQTLVISEDPYRDVPSPTDTATNTVITRRRQKQTMRMTPGPVQHFDEKTNSYRVFTTEELEQRHADWETTRLAREAEIAEEAKQAKRPLAESSSSEEDSSTEEPPRISKQARTKGHATTRSPLELELEKLREEYNRPPPQSNTGSLFRPKHNSKLHEIMQEQRVVEARMISNAQLLQKVKPNTNNTEVEKLARQLGL